MRSHACSTPTASSCPAQRSTRRRGESCSDEFVHRRIEQAHVPVASFSVGVDYPTLIHGRTGVTAVHEFLASRRITLPDGSTDDPPDAGDRERPGEPQDGGAHGVPARGSAHVFQGARLYWSSSATPRCVAPSCPARRAHSCCPSVHRAPAPGSPSPTSSSLQAATSASTGHTVVLETTTQGVDAARAGGFEMVVAVERDRSTPLRRHGADLVVPDLGELLERQLIS